MCTSMEESSIYYCFHSVFAHDLAHSKKLSTITYCLIMLPILAYDIIGNKPIKD